MKTAPFKWIVAVLAMYCPLCAHGDADILKEPRFPTQAHKKYPLASVSEYTDGKRIRKAVPYEEPEFVRPMEKRFERFKSLTFPLPEEEADEVRYFTGISHIHGVIPQGHNQVAEDRIGTAYLHKFVYANGQVKNVYGVPEDGSPEFYWSVMYDDEKRIVISGSFHKGALSEVLICQYPLTDGAFNLTAPPLRKFRFSPKSARVQYEIYEKGKHTKSVASPYPLAVTLGKFPCQAERYSIALANVVANESLPVAEKVSTVLQFIKLEPFENEEEAHGGSGYSTLRYSAILSLGELRDSSSLQALVALLEEERMRGIVARSLAKHANPQVLPHLLGALEHEDHRVRKNGYRRNAHHTTCAIVEAMLDISHIEANKLIDEFLKSEDRFFADNINRTRARKLTRK